MLPSEHAKIASDAALALMSPALVAAAQDVLVGAALRTKRTALSEATADAEEVRTSPLLSGAVANAQRKAGAMVIDVLTNAKQDGFISRGKKDAEAIGLLFEFSPSDAADLASHPIVDATIQDHADRLARDLAWRIRSVATRVAVGSLPLAGMVSALSFDWQRWADQVARLAEDAWHSGGSAAVTAMAEALAIVPTPREK